MSNFSVILKRIIAVDSASYAYVEVPLDLNIVLLGTGNLGKSSIVNAVRFFLLPEVNVNHADKKFGFVSGASDSADVNYFTKDQIYDHYFPTNNSRLILEVEHKLVDGSTRQHCQIISKGGNYKLQRAFIPSPYSDIEHLFWNKSSPAGERPDMKVGDQLLPKLKSINPATRHITQIEHLTSALYTVDILRPDTCPFVIFPINEIRLNSVDSLRALVKMLFNQDSSSLRRMTATAIEAKDATNQILELDIAEIINEQRVLRSRKATLDKLSAAAPIFHSLKEKFSTLVEEKTVAKEFAQRVINTTAYLTDLEKQSYDIGTQRAKTDAELSAEQKVREEHKANKHYYERTIRALESKLSQFIRKTEQFEKICLPYSNMGPHDIVELLQDEWQHCENTLKNYTDQQHRKQRIADIEKAIIDWKQQLNTLQNKANNAAFSLQVQLDKHTWDKLNSMNSSLSKANPSRLLTQEERHAINEFTSLLQPHHGDLTFFDERIPHIKDIDAQPIETKIDDAQTELAKLVQEKKELEALSANKRIQDAKKIEDLRKQKNLLEKDIDTLNQYPALKHHALEHKTEMVNAELELKKINDQLSSGDVRYQQLSDKSAELKTAQDERHKEIQSLQGLLNSHAYVKNRFASVNAWFSSLKPQQPISKAHCADPNTLQRLSDRLEGSEIAKGDVRQKLSDLIMQGTIEDEYGILTGNRNDEAIIDTFKSLENRYALLEQSQQVLARDTDAHNTLVRNRLVSLSKTKEKIEVTITQINNELLNAKVNDLDAVRLVVKLNGHFHDLINSWREFDDVSSQGTLPEEWYARLKVFLESDAVNKHDGKLRMDNIVQQARYETRKPNEAWDDKDQSTSTKMLINMHFCDIFIQQLSSETSQVAFPLIMDEIGKVSSEQFPGLIKGLNQKGHWLVGVTTHGKSGDLIAPFNHHLVMDEVKTAHPYSGTRRNVCFPLDEVEKLTIKSQYALVESV